MNHTLIATVLSNAGYNRPDVLANILIALPKPDVAVSMLLGVHEPLGHCQYYQKDNVLCTVESIDEIKDIVKYSYYTAKTKYVYYLTREDRENGVYTEERPKGDYYTTGNIPIGGYSSSTSTDRVDDFFRRYTPITESEYFQTLELWQDFKDTVPSL